MSHPTIRDVLGQAAERSSDATALLDPERGRSVSFADLDGRATAISDGLLRADFQPGDHLSVLVRDSVEFVELLFGTVGAGVVFHPIGPRAALDRLAHVIDHAESAGLVFDDSCRERVARLDRDTLPRRVYAVGGDESGDGAADVDAADYEALVGDSDARVGVDTDEDDPALLLYTSGTTGRPKGVRHSHRNVVTGDLVCLPYNRLRPSDVAVAFGPLYHVGPLCCNFLPALHVGATNVLVRDFDPETALSRVEAESITAMWGVPTHFNALVNHETAAERDLTSVRMIQYSGAAMPAAVARTIRKRTTDCDLVNAYGTTEIIFGTVLHPEEHDDRLGSIGRAVPNAAVRLVDPENPAPDATVRRGQTGEILVRTPTRMLGYWRAPRETEAAVVDGWYRTGDLGRRDEDGYVYFVDRKDNMIISGGENVYPAEVESVLHDHPDVVSAAVVGVPDERWGEIVTAVVVGGDEPPSAVALDEFVRESDAVENFKRPRRYELRPELPKTQSDKIDRQALLAELDTE